MLKNLQQAYCIFAGDVCYNKEDFVYRTARAGALLGYGSFVVGISLCTPAQDAQKPVSGEG